MRIVAIFVALALTSCAAAAIQREIDRRETVRQQEEEANAIAGRRTRQWCQEHPEGCDLRLVAIAHEDHTEWDRLRVPPYSVFMPVLEEELRKRIQFSLAEEYYWRITTTLYLQLEQHCR